MVNCNEANCTCKMVNCVRHGKCCARLYFKCSADKEKTVRWGW